MIWRAALKAYSRTSLPARGPGCLGLRKGLRTCMPHVLRWCYCCCCCYCFIGHTPTSTGLATSNGFSVQEEACLPFLNPVNSCILSSLDKTSAGGAGAREPGSIWQRDGPALPRVLLPSWKLGFGLWAGTCTYLYTLKLNLALWGTCPMSSVNHHEELYFPLKGWWVPKLRTFLWPSPLKFPLLNRCCN